MSSAWQDGAGLTAFRQAAATAERAEAGFLSLMECLPLKVFIKDLFGRYLFCNRRFALDLGLEPAQIVGHTDIDFYTSEQARQFRREDRAIIANGDGFDLHESTYQDGIEKIVHVVKTPFRDAYGVTLGVIGAIIDITERKQAELKLRELAYEFEDAYQNAPCGYHSIDADARFLRINNTELKWLGYSREEIVGCMCLTDLLSEASQPLFAGYFEAFKRSGSVKDLELELVRRDGCLLPVVISATAVYDDQGRFVCSRAVVSDVSERRELERQQHLQQRRMAELSHRLVAVQEDERRRLACELHDRTSPNLVAIQLSLDNLLETLGPGLGKAQRETIEDMRALIEDTMASVREICTELRPPLLDYAGLLPALDAYCQQVARRIGIDVEFEARMAGVQLGKDVESLLFRIVQESITNCAKHASAQRICVALSGDAQRTVLTISDDGLGFSPQLLGQDAAAQPPGLGLISMRERAEFAGGRLQIESRPGGGTRIQVELDLGAPAVPGATLSVPDRMQTFSERRSLTCRRRSTDRARVPAIERRVQHARRRDDRVYEAAAAQLRFS